MNDSTGNLSKSSSSSLSFIFLIAGSAALGGFLFGFDTAVINGAVAALQKHFQIGSLLTGLSVSLALIGSALGALIAGPLADRFGRTRMMLVAAIMFSISALGSGAPFTIFDFIFWRILGGIGVGIASVIAPAYIAEIAPANLRGRLGSLQQLAIVVGIFIALLSNFLIASLAESAENPWLFDITAWRWMFWTEIPPAILYGVGSLVIPESPRFLIAQGRDAEATAVLQKVEGSTASQTVANIKATVSEEHKPSFRDIFGRKGLLPIVWVGIGLSVLQQFVGINVIFYYSSVLWRSVGFTESSSLLITVITGLVNIITTLIAIATVDRFGRKPLLLLGSIGMVLTLGTLATIFGTAPVDPTTGEPNLTGSAGIIALLAANLYVFCFGFSWGPVVWVLLGEMFNNKIRGAALSVAAGMQWVANFIVSTSFPPLLTSVGLGAAYGLYTTAAAISIFFVLFFVKETKGKTLEQM
jgi:SP family sugar:H+ symporter-like MFS transporter